MKIDKKVIGRAEQLIFEGERLSQAQPMWNSPGGPQKLYEIQGWLASALNLVEVIFPNPGSAHRHRVQTIESGEVSEANKVGFITEVLRAILEDAEAGLITTLADAARNEVFDDFLDHADHYLSGNKIAQAGVIAGVVFEDTVRRACEKNAIVQSGVKLDELITRLVEKSLITAVKAKRARAAAGVRTSATHAQWDQFERGDVESTIAVTRELIDQLLES